MFTITNKVKEYLIKGAFVLLCAGAVWQNFKILEAKNDRIDIQEGTIAQLVADNEELKKEIVNKSKSDVVTQLVKEEVKKEEVKQEKAKTQANLYVEEKLAAIEKKYAELEKSATNEERMRTEISLERAKGLWLTFCLQEPEQQACK